jgi:hypothetical protein
VVHGVDAAKKVPQKIFVADVALVELGIGAQVRWRRTSVDGRRERVEDDHLVTELEETVNSVGSDETGTPCDEDLHRRWRRRSAASRQTSVAATP